LIEFLFSASWKEDAGFGSATFKMGTFATVALVIFGISFMTFVTFFGRLPALR
jgi:hypothetical protein